MVKTQEKLRCANEEMEDEADEMRRATQTQADLAGIIERTG